MLTFISFWRAAAIVLNDMGSSAFYAGAIAEQAVGKAAPWFVLGVMFFALAVRAVYVESGSMFVRGGVYRVVKEALGGTLAKISVSALIFDYILTGPISGVSAGHYISGLINDVLHLAHTHGVPLTDFSLPDKGSAVFFAVLMTLYYWWQNIKGIEESSEKALRVMKIVTVMVVILLGWAAITLMRKGGQLPPAPIAENLHFSPDALGFLKDVDWAKTFGLFGVLVAFGHSILAMSGEETLAQVNREIEAPKLKNLKRAAVVIGIFTILFTGVGTVLAVMIVPDDVRIAVYKDNLISGMAMHMVGPQILRTLFQIFVVVCGFLMLSGAINTSMVGSNGVMNRISEDGVLTDWFRKPHPKFGTSYRIINLITGLQLLTILGSRGDMFLLGEAYAFGVIWSFTFNSLSMLVLRFKYKGERGWKVPLNPVVFGVEIPIGLSIVFFSLFTLAIVNLLTKSVATIAGVAFTTVFFIIFTISERVNMRKFQHVEREMKEHFQLLQEDTISRESVDVRPGNVLVTVRDYNTLDQLRWVLERTDTDEQDVVVMSARLTGLGTGQHDMAMEQIFSEYEQTLFTRAVAVAEGVGKHISLLVVPARDVWTAIVQTANSLQTEKVVAGLSSKMTAQEQAFHLGRAWEAMDPPKRQFTFVVVRPDGTTEEGHIGPHNPRLTEDDVHLVHRVWLNLTRLRGLEKLHHDEIVSEALSRLARDLSGHEHDEIIRSLKHRGRDTRHDPTETQKQRPFSTPPPSAPPEDTMRLQKRLDEQERESKDKKKEGGGGPPPPPVVGP
ncbi:MAG TPA: APC family permease [Terriglobales bacterium]|nr:APC family permease [Terriglobales bacterium]